MRERIGQVEAIAVRPVDGAPMELVSEIAVRAGAGALREGRRSRTRGLTLLSAEAWRDTCDELGIELPWHTRRANLLVSGVHLSTLIGRTIEIGSLRLLIHGETKPCGIMDQAFPGLKNALQANFRGGVHAEVLTDGTLAKGAALYLLPANGGGVSDPPG